MGTQHVTVEHRDLGR